MLGSPANNDFALLLCRRTQAEFYPDAGESTFHAQFAFHDLDIFMNCSTPEVSSWIKINGKKYKLTLTYYF